MPEKKEKRNRDFEAFCFLYCFVLVSRMGRRVINLYAGFLEDSKPWVICNFLCFLSSQTELKLTIVLFSSFDYGVVVCFSLSPFLFLWFRF